jgi:hypothetical protein
LTLFHKIGVEKSRTVDFFRRPQNVTFYQF